MEKPERCAMAGCGRFVRRGAIWCRVHAGEQDPAIDGTGEDTRVEAAAEFRRRLAAGDYQKLIDDAVKEVIAQAAIERGLAGEIGALRVVLARLLMEEEDLSKLVAGVARLTAATVQAARAQRTIAGEVGDGLAESINRFLAELETA